MNFSQVLAEVLLLTKRPDLSSLTETAINSAVSQSTMKASFAKDLVETTLTIDPTLYGDTIQFDNVVLGSIVRFRKFKYIKPTGVKRYLTPIGADKIFTPGNSMQLDRYYVGGNSLTYTLRELNSSLEIGYYQYPVVMSLNNGYTHWMLDLMPYTIIDLAAARIFKHIGDDSSFKIHEGLGQDSYKVCRRDFEDSILPGAF